MANIQQKLAESLKELQQLQNKAGVAIVSYSDLTRTHLQRLVQSGFLEEVMRGWYISSRPDILKGDTTNWFTSYWHFITHYANTHFGDEWCLSADQSLAIYSGNRTAPTQLIIRVNKESSNNVKLLHSTSILYFKASLANHIYKDQDFNLNLYSLEEALIECSPDFFKLDSIAARTCLSMVTDVGDILKIILEEGQTIKAGRLVGAFRNIGNIAAADEIMETMKSLSYDIREEDPFEHKSSLAYTRTKSPYTTRLKLMWNKMRSTVMEHFPSITHQHTDIESCLQSIDTQYLQDAYHSLSIEGYQVTDDLIKKVESGDWHPDSDTHDAQQRNAMAARGYWQAFQAVKTSIEKILAGKNPGEVIDSDHRTWYREPFAPATTVGIIQPSDLAGYRNSQVYIRGSMHVPLNADAVRDVMPTLFELLGEEPDARVRAILGHFFFGYIHPYSDGNGRIARFLMNTMLISGGYNWTIVPVERRQEYMQALEEASVRENIAPFTQFIASLIEL